MSEVASTAAGAPARATRPWTQAWLEALPLAPVWGGLALAVGHLLLGAVYHAFFVAPQPSAWWSSYRQVLDSTAVFALLVGYAPAALAYACRAHRTALRDLRPALACTEAEFSELRRETIRFDMPLLRSVGLIAVLGALATTLFTTGVLQRFPLGSPTLNWILWQNALAFWLAVRSIVHDLRVSVSLSKAAERHAAIDLFALAPLAPLARRGLQSALLIILGVSIFSLILGVGDAAPLVPVTQAATITLAACALALPSLGAHRRIRAAKREELGRLSEEIRAARERLSTTPSSEQQPVELRLATLLTLKHHVDTTREWPFDLGTLGRFLLYTAIGLGSWLGGAVVERVLNQLLG